MSDESKQYELFDEPNEDTISIDLGSMSSSYTMSSTIGTISIPSYTASSGAYTITTGTNPVSWTSGGYYNTTDAAVQINTDGITVKDGGDIKIGNKSLSEAIEKIEERLGILRPNDELEERWEKLKDLRKQYMELEKDILEKERIMNILKDKS